ncbi:MAG: cupin domain-containing protein [Solirubrobacteraceae bacterium]
MRVDFTQPVWDADRFPGRHVAHVGAQAGARELAASVYELDPGAVGSPLHAHHGNEELLLVLAGTPSLRGPDGTQLLWPGAVVAFPRGKPGAHSLVNRSDAAVRYLVVSTTNRPDIVEYLDTGATLVVLEEQRLAYPVGADADQEPVIAEAMRAAADQDA